MRKTLDTVEVVTGADPRCSVIWLHGLGADGHDFEPIVPALNLRAAARFLFPHAPVRAVTLNQGMAMRAWYDILALDRLAAEDEPGIRASQAAVASLIDAERDRGIAAESIVLAGFSQGGAIALHTALRFPAALAGVVALSAYLPLRSTFEAERSHANSNTPVFMAHGSHDPVLPEALAVESARLLRQNGYAVEWHSYPMGHTVCAEEVEDIARWLNSRLDATRPQPQCGGVSSENE